MRRYALSIGVLEMIWLCYTLVIFLSPEDRIAAKIFMLIIFIYFASLVSYIIGKTKLFVLLSLTASVICYYIFFSFLVLRKFW